jgi:DNA repair exonuclease SbcCD ATPase subunit
MSLTNTLDQRLRDAVPELVELDAKEARARELLAQVQQEARDSAAGGAWDLNSLLNGEPLPAADKIAAIRQLNEIRAEIAAELNAWLTQEVKHLRNLASVAREPERLEVINDECTQVRAELDEVLAGLGSVQDPATAIERGVAAEWKSSLS